MKYWHYTFIIGLSLITALAFQNCGSSELQFEDLESTEIANFLAYPYTSAPKFYSDIFLFRPASQNTLSQFKFLGTVTYPTLNTTTVQYEVKIQTPDGQTVCPTQTGNLLNGASSIEFDCVSLRSTESLDVKLTVSAGGFQQVTEKKYR